MMRLPGFSRGALSGPRRCGSSAALDHANAEQDERAAGEVDVIETPDWKDPKVAARPDFDYVEASFTMTATCSLLHVYATY